MSTLIPFISIASEIVGVSSAYPHNIKKFIWTLTGILLDLYFTKGVTTGMLTVLGIAGQCIVRLNKEKGEVCIYKELWRKGTKTIKEIHNSLRGKDCLFKDLSCMYRNESGTCVISKEDIQEGIGRMREDGIVKKNASGKWKAEF